MPTLEDSALLAQVDEAQRKLSPCPLHLVWGDASPERGVFAIRIEERAEGSLGQGASGPG